MASLEGSVELLRESGHQVQLLVKTGIEMKEERFNSARHIFTHCKRANKLPQETLFQPEVVDLSDIED